MSVSDSHPPGPHSCPSCGATIPAELEICPSCEETQSLSAPRARASRYTGPKEIGGFRLLRQLGAGGMGTVFEAFEEKMNRRVALKILSRHLSESEKAGDRFAREAWIAGKLSHPNLVKVFERGETEDVAFYSMELVDGGSLYDVIRRLKTEGKDATWSLEFGSREHVTWALTQIVAAARGLDYAHRQGVVHRDVKPMNILLSREPCLVKVADFGLAVDLEATRLTSAGAVLGTVAYMAPEQVRGRQDQIAPSTDVYSLGVTLFELLTLDLPFAGKTQQLYMNAVLTAESKRPRKLNGRVSRDLETVLQKALEKEPGDRYPSAGAFADDLENVLRFRPIRARPPGAGTRVIKFARRKPMHAAFALLLLLAVPSISLLSYRFLQHRRLVDRLETAKEKELVRRLNHDERFGQALTHLDRILGRHPEDVEMLRTRAVTLYRLALIESDKNRQTQLQEQALADASSLVRLLPRASWPYRVRACLFRAFQRTADAEKDESVAARLRSAPASDVELELDGILALNAGKYPEALDAYTEIIGRHSDASEARLQRALIYDHLDEIDKAMTDYEVASALKPSDPVPRVNMGVLLTRKNDLDGGAAQLRQALEIDPKFAPAYQNLADNLDRRGKGKVDLGDREGALKDFRDAEAAARRAVQLDSGFLDAHLNLGVALMDLNRLAETPQPTLMAEATQEYEKVISAHESEGRTQELLSVALANQCDALIQLGDLPRALSACREIARLQPDSAINHYNLAGVYALSGRPEDALGCLQRDFDLGDREFKSLSDDKWFVSLRGDSRFVSLLERMKTTPFPEKTPER